MRKTVLIFVLFLFFSGCSSFRFFECPYTIVDSSIRVFSEHGSENSCTLLFSVQNNSNKTIEAFTVLFKVYDSDGISLVPDSGSIVARICADIPPGYLHNSIVHFLPEILCSENDDYSVDSFYVREIQYSDGSTWNDFYGMYCFKERYE